jgi:hypothetical protein
MMVRRRDLWKKFWWWWFWWRMLLQGKRGRFCIRDGGEATETQVLKRWIWWKRRFGGRSSAQG